MKKKWGTNQKVQPPQFSKYLDTWIPPPCQASLFGLIQLYPIALKKSMLQVN